MKVTDTHSPLAGSSSPSDPEPKRKWGALAVAVLALVIVGATFDVRAGLRDLLVMVEQLGAWGPIMFVTIYVLATVLFIPGSVLTLGAGALFGVAWGCVYVSLASTLGATAAFLVGRYYARDWVVGKIAGQPIFTAVDRAVAAEGWKIVGLTRLSPVFPFTLLNYAFGVTRVRLRDYVIASWLGMMPGTVMFVYLGSLARAGATEREKTPAEWALYGLGFVATGGVTVVITRIARAALARRTQAVGT